MLGWGGNYGDALAKYVTAPFEAATGACACAVTAIALNSRISMPVSTAMDRFMGVAPLPCCSLAEHLA